ncbi:MAG: hypothetical protein RL318_24 [Fibrobacterota bacterium]|jgi:hypothetical protein
MRSHHLIIPLILTIFVLGACAKGGDPLLELERACGDGRDSSACLQVGKAWLSGEEPTLPVALERKARLEKFLARWNTDAFLAVHAGWLTRTGGAYSKAGDVIKAVESVDAGLAEFEAGHLSYPGSTWLRLTHALTLSHLPPVFRKDAAARDSLSVLVASGVLSARERTLVDSALSRLSSGKD